VHTHVKSHTNLENTNDNPIKEEIEYILIPGSRTLKAERQQQQNKKKKKKGKILLKGTTGGL